MPRSTTTCPPSGCSSPTSKRNSVVLPEPFGPTRPTFSPRFTLAEASMNRICRPWFLLTESKRITARKMSGEPALRKQSARFPAVRAAFGGRLPPLADSPRLRDHEGDSYRRDGHGRRGRPPRVPREPRGRTSRVGFAQAVRSLAPEVDGGGGQ